LSRRIERQPHQLTRETVFRQEETVVCSSRDQVPIFDGEELKYSALRRRELNGDCPFPPKRRIKACEEELATPEVWLSIIQDCAPAVRARNRLGSPRGNGGSMLDVPQAVELDHMNLRRGVVGTCDAA
jgi:hypothetical protein